MNSLLSDVKEFLEEGLCEIPDTFNDQIDTQRLILALIFEEFLELAQAMHPEARKHARELIANAISRPIDETSPTNPTEVIDAIVDLFYVTANGAILLGIKNNVESHYKKVHAQNMTKVMLTEDQVFAIVRKYGKDNVHTFLKENGRYVVKSLTGKILKPVDFPTSDEISTREH